MDYYTIPLKTCTKCNRLLPATTFFFYRDSHTNDGLQTRCKKCRSEAKKKKRQDNPEWAHEEDRKERLKHREKRIQNKREWYQKNKNHVRAYDLKNRDKQRAQENARRRANRAKYRLEYKIWYKKRGIEYHKGWREKNPDKVRTIKLNRRARVQSLPNTLTPEQWQHALDYFNGCCAVCGRQLKDLFGTHTVAADHWIPLSHEDCPGTVATNIVPLCHGEGGCNNIKHDRLPEVYLKEHFSTRKANEILKRVQDYFDSLST